MHLEDAKSAVSAASAALLVLCLAVGAFLPPLNATVTASVPLTVALSLAIACSLILHLIFVGIAARSLGRSRALWTALALFTLPIGSIVGIVMFEWRLRALAAQAPHSAA